VTAMLSSSEEVNEEPRLRSVRLVRLELPSIDDRDRRDVDPSDLRLLDRGRTELEFDNVPNEVNDSRPFFLRFVLGETVFGTEVGAQDTGRVVSVSPFLGEADLVVLEFDSERGRAFLVLGGVSFDLSPVSADAG
jgi:hypothetical protein